MPDLEGIYLDNASTSYPKPKAVYEAVSEFALSCGASPGRGAYPRALEAEDMLARCRSDVAKLLGVRNPTRIAFASGSTEALNWAIKGVLTRPGDHAVVTALEHNAVLRPLQWLNRTREVTWSVVPCNDDGHVEPADIAEAIRPETRLLCAVHASNVLGTLLPIRDIVEVAHGRGVPVLVDGSQTAGSVPFSVEDLEIDLFAFTGHKSLLGPPGSGGLYVRPGLEIETWKEGGTGLHSESLDAPLEMPARLEAGTPNTWGLAGLIGGVEWLLHTGVEYVRGHEMHLAQRLGDELRQIANVLVYGPSDASKKTSVVLANVASLNSGDVGLLLAERYGIAVRTGLHCAPLAHEAIGTLHSGGAVRFSIGPFNTQEEVDAAAAAVREIASAARCRQRGGHGVHVR